MRNQVILLSLLSSLTATGCNTLECADGTVERDGRCEAADSTTTSASCGPFTMLVGDRCVPTFPPTECDPDTTAPTTDEATGVRICIGTGTSCNSAIACPTPTSSSRMTICGQLYDFETNAKLAATGASGVRCDPDVPTADGPCALDMVPYDAYAFGQNPGTALPLPATDVYIDDCGRYRVSEIDLNGTGPFIGLGVDDANTPFGPDGVAVTSAVATQKQPAGTTRNFEAWIVRPSTASMWAAGGATLATGIYAPVFRAHAAGNPLDVYPFPNQAGVTLLNDGTNTGVNDYYFAAAATNRQMLDGAATSTGANGTVLMTNATLADGNSPYGGQGGLGQGCRWETHAGASLPGIVFIQTFRKLDLLGQTCND